MRKGVPSVLLLVLFSPGLMLAQNAAPTPPPAPASGPVPAPNLPAVVLPPPGLPDHTGPLAAAASCAAPACPTPEEPSPTRLWGGGEYLLWWTKKVPVTTPLVTSASPDPVTSGALGQAGTHVLLGGQDYDLPERQGGRFTLGGWLTPDQVIGFEASYFFLKEESLARIASGNGSAAAPILGVPFFDPSLPGETFTAFAVPGVAVGTHELILKNSLQGYEGNAIARLINSGCLRLDALVGFRYLQFRENLAFASAFTAVPGGGLDGTSLTTVDVFEAHNDFYGGQAGLRGEVQLGCGFFINATAKAALGSMNESMNIGGGSSLVSPLLPGPLNTPAGLFATGTNSGHFTRDQFAVVPEGDFNAGYEFKKLRVFVGYSFLYASNVARPGPQIDHQINTTGSVLTASTTSDLAGQPRPAFSFRSSDFWAQGVNFGLQFSY